MPETDIGSADYGDMTNTVTDFSVTPVETDGALDQKETEWINPDWAKQLGYYKKIAEYRNAIDALARWTVGKGYTSNEITEMLLMGIRGHGKDTFNTILENQDRVAKISGDSFAEVIRDNDEVLANLKPLDPSKVKIIANKKGIIIRYEYIGKGDPIKFKPEEIFHLSRNRTADEIHGESLLTAVEEIILMRNEAMADMRQLMHRHVKPIIAFKLDTDDKVEIDAFILKADTATAKGENLFYPKDTVEHEVISVAANATLNPLQWIDRLNAYFSQAVGVPQILIGGSGEITEASAKIAYLAFEQTIKEEQLYIMEQVLAQLNLEIVLEIPASLENELLSDKSKSETMQASTPEDTSVKGVGLEETA